MGMAESIMSEETNALLALQHAWQGAVDTAGALEAAGAALHQLDAATPVSSLPLDDYHRLALANANAAQALRGLIEQLQRKAERPG
jgi:hypothetical protein